MQVNPELAKIQAQLDVCEGDIRDLTSKIDEVETMLANAAPDDVAYFRTEKEQLRKKEEQLRKKEEQLRTEKEQLRKKEERFAKEQATLFYRTAKEVDFVIDGETVTRRIDRLTWEKYLQEEDAPHGLQLAGGDQVPVVFGFDELESGKAYRVVSEKERRQSEHPAAISFFTRARAEDGSIVYQPAVAEFWSQKEFKEWLEEPGQRHQLWARVKGQPQRRIHTLEQARNAPKEASLMLEAAGDLLQQSIVDLQGFVKNHSSGIEHQTTKAIVRDASLIDEFGPLQLVSDGRAVTFFNATTRMKALEVDGMVLSTSVLLVNESKAAPVASDAADAVRSVAILRDILRHPSRFSSEPADVLQTIQGVERIVGVLSGFTFSSAVLDACHDNNLRAVCTNGEGYSVSN